MKKNAKEKNVHWTTRSIEDMQYFVGADFVDQLREAMEIKGVTQRDLASRIDVTEGRISQVFNEPGNLTLQTMLNLSSAAGAKASVVVYVDADANRSAAPLGGAIFSECWKHSGSPIELPGVEYWQSRVSIQPAPYYQEPATPSLPETSQGDGFEEKTKNQEEGGASRSLLSSLLKNRQSIRGLAFSEQSSTVN